MDVVLLIGRVLFVTAFVTAGVMAHFKMTDGMASWAASRGLPAAKPLVLFSGTWIIAASLMVVLGIWTDLGFLMLAAFSLTAAVLLHNFWRDEDPMEAMRQNTQFMKNISLTGGALALFALFATVGDGIGMQLTGPLFDLDL